MYCSVSVTLRVDILQPTKRRATHLIRRPLDVELHAVRAWGQQRQRHGVERLWDKQALT